MRDFTKKYFHLNRSDVYNSSAKNKKVGDDVKNNTLYSDAPKACYKTKEPGLQQCTKTTLTIGLS